MKTHYFGLVISAVGNVCAQSTKVQVCFFSTLLSYITLLLKSLGSVIVYFYFVLKEFDISLSKD